MSSSDLDHRSPPAVAMVSSTVIATRPGMLGHTAYSKGGFLRIAPWERTSRRRSHGSTSALAESHPGRPRHWVRRLPVRCPFDSPFYNSRHPQTRRSGVMPGWRERLNSVQEKIGRIAEGFAEGQVNRAQFQELFDHYQRERRTILAWIDTTAEVPNWRELAAEGRSMIIRRQHKARVLGYAICEQQSGLPLRSIGMFEEDPELVVPMLTAYRSATEEIFGAGMRSTEVEGGRWVCFVAGEFTMLMVLFSNEPARKDLEGLDELLRTFERMNRYILRRHPIPPDDLFLPYRFYIDSPK